MIKKLDREEKKDEKNPQRRAENKDEVALSSKSFFTTITFPENKLPITVYAKLDGGKEIKLPRSVFHPPSA